MRFTSSFMAQLDNKGTTSRGRANLEKDPGCVFARSLQHGRWRLVGAISLIRFLF